MDWLIDWLIDWLLCIGADPEEDPLAWVEENIAGVEPALPAIDSEVNTLTS